MVGLSVIILTVLIPLTLALAVFFMFWSISQHNKKYLEKQASDEAEAQAQRDYTKEMFAIARRQKTATDAELEALDLHLDDIGFRRYGDLIIHGRRQA